MAKPISIEKTITLGAKVTTVKGSSIASTSFYAGNSDAISNFKFQYGDALVTKTGKCKKVFIQFNKPYTGLIYGKVSPISTDAKVVSIKFDASTQYSADVYDVDASKIITVGSVTDPDSVEVAPAVKIDLKLNMTVGEPQLITLEEGTEVTVSYKSGKTTVSGDRTITAFIYTVNQKFEPEFVGVVLAESTTVDEVTTITYEDVLFTDILSIAEKVELSGDNQSAPAG